MRTVGVRELKNRLSEYLRRVRAGESVLVTDRGEVVAELTVPGRGSGQEAGPEGLLTLARKGAVTLGAANTAEVYPALAPLLRTRGALELLDEERGSS